MVEFKFYELKKQHLSIKDQTDRTFLLHGPISDPGS